MTKATQQLVNFLLIMVMILLVATEMHVTIFGVYTDLYDTQVMTGSPPLINPLVARFPHSGVSPSPSQLHAFLGTFNSFANGLNFDNNSKDIKNSEVGYTRNLPDYPDPNPDDTDLTLITLIRWATSSSTCSRRSCCCSCCRR